MKAAGFSLKSNMTPRQQFKLAKQQGLGVAGAMAKYLRAQEMQRSPQGNPDG